MSLTMKQETKNSFLTTKIFHMKFYDHSLLRNCLLHEKMFQTKIE